jgi:serine/threonine-protein kinase RIO1
MRRVNGKFNMNDFVVEYDFQAVTRKDDDFMFRMRFNKIVPDPSVIFIAGILLMHFLADDNGCRIDISEVPKLADPDDIAEQAEKYEKGEKQ